MQLRLADFSLKNHIFHRYLAGRTECLDHSALDPRVAVVNHNPDKIQSARKPTITSKRSLSYTGGGHHPRPLSTPLGIFSSPSAPGAQQTYTPHPH